MGAIVVCPLSRLPTMLRQSGAEDVVTLLTEESGSMPPIDVRRHLRLAFGDIAAAEAGYVLADTRHVEDLLGFATAWDRRRPLLIHCYAGVSRSTAAAYAVACAHRPDVAEMAWAERLRRLSPTATPNPRIIALADMVMGRQGRMVDAIARIGRGIDCFEGVPFRLEIGDQMPPYQS